MTESTTAAAERAYVQKATAKDGEAFQNFLRHKGFVDPSFVQTWGAVTEVLNQKPFGPRILDLGCGPGWTSLFLAARGLDVTAADLSPDMLAIAVDNAKRHGVTIRTAEADMQAGFDLGRDFDGVLIFDALHHCQDETAVLRHCFQALRPGGSILLVEPDWFHEYGGSARHDRREFGTTERGMGWGRMSRALRAAGFGDLQRFYSLQGTFARSPWQRLRSLAVAALTVTVGFPHRSVIGYARKPG
ncbi:MAG: methyltransferase domain-containing protein [Deltaproteobacteria bacterium]|nr:methyltransferase domain-containing protein [Deltaproteobacteria bacterium]